MKTTHSRFLGAICVARAFTPYSFSPFAAKAEVSPYPADSVRGMTLSGYTADEIKSARLKSEARIITAGTPLPDTEGHVDSVRRLMDLFYYDQYHHFQDPLAPYFMLMSKDAKFALGLGGNIRLRGWYDFAGSIDGSHFTPYDIPIPSDPGKQRGIGASAGGTSIFLRVIGRTSIGDVTGYVQGQFSQGPNNQFRLKKAYVVLNDWTVGYTHSIFNDADAEAPTIDDAGQNALGGRSCVTVRYDHSFRAPWGVGAGLMFPDSQVNADGIHTKTVNDWFPDLGVYGQYLLPHDGHIRLSAMMRVLPYRDLVAQKNRNRIGWGVQLSAVAYPIPRLALYLEANTGRGYSAYMGDISSGTYDLLDDPSRPGRMDSPWSFGINVGCKYNFLPNLYAAMALAEARNYHVAGMASDDYKYGLYGSWSLFYEPTPRIQIGAEYLAGKRQNFDRTHGNANRIDLLFQLSF